MSEEVSSKVFVVWKEFCQDVADLQRDVEKNCLKSNVSAGVRSRKGMRELRKKLTEMLKLSLEVDKAVVEARKTENASKE